MLCFSGEDVGFVVSSVSDEFELFLHDLLVGSGSDEVSVCGGI